MADETIPLERNLSGVVLARAIRRNIVAGALGSIYGMLVMGFFLAGYAKALGLSNVEFGFMAAIPMLVFPARLLSSFIVEHLGRRKNFFTVTAIAARLVWIGIICLPFVITDASNFRSALFLMLLLTSSTIGALAEPAWFSWIGDLIPENMRARFWSKRSMYVGITGIVPTILLALLKDRLTHDGNTLTQFSGFAVVFGFAIFCGIVDLIIHYGIPEPKMTRHEHQAQRLKALLEPIKDPRFRPYLVFNGAWTFSLALIGSFGFKHFFEIVEEAGAGYPFTSIALISTLSALASVLGYSVWGMLIQRYGSKPILRLCTLLTCFTPLPWLFVTAEHPYLPTTFAFVIGGFTFSGVATSRMNLMYGLSPRKNRSMYVAINLTVVGICGALAPILAGYFLRSMDGRQFLGLGGFYILCIGTSMARLYTRTLLYRVREGKNVSPGFVVRRLTEANPFRVFQSLYVLTSPATEEKKLSAVGRLGDSRSKIATKDLVDHLEDPSPKVREEAAHALAKSKDPEAVDALIEKLDSPGHGLESHSARALGEIGDERGVEPLISSLEHPDRRVRASAAQALGNIGDRRAGEPLFRLLKSEQDELTFGSYATALSALGEISAIWHILPVMRNTASVFFRRQLAVAIGDLIGEPKVFYGYLDEECKVFGQRAGKIFNRCRRLVSRRQDNRLRDRREEILELIVEAESAYINEDWPGCAEKVAAMTHICTQAVFDMTTNDQDEDAESRIRSLDRFEKIYLIIGHNEKLGMQLWYPAALTHEKDADLEKLTFEGCLLSIYVLQFVIEALLPAGPPAGIDNT
ncbi:MAG: MFS transporter [Planctomycetes bacterium]|nr:MFS transporter [Planctomycetota bacterium]